MKNRVTRGFRALIVFLCVVAGVGGVASEARATCRVDYILCPDCTGSDGNFSAPPDSTLTFKARPVGCSITNVTWTVTKKTDDGSDEWSKGFPYSTIQLIFSYTFTELGTYEVHVRFDPEGAERQVSLQIKKNEFTVKIISSDGGTVIAGDGDIDVSELDGNGIACSGNETEGLAECQETYRKEQVVSLKVIPDEGRIFLGWRVNGKIVSEKELLQLLE